MKIDLTLKVTPQMTDDAQGNLKAAVTGHLGTHFDVMDKEFPLEYTERRAMVFDVSRIRDRDIEAADIDLSRIEKDMFVAFLSDFMEEEPYGTHRYFRQHPQLSHELIEELLAREISIIGLDFSGLRRGKEHTPMDQHCADRNVFVVENLCNLRQVLKISDSFTARTYPMNFAGLTGLPCRVVAEL